jgi:hypothetical protein
MMESERWMEPNQGTFAAPLVEIYRENSTVCKATQAAAYAAMLAREEEPARCSTALTPTRWG